MKHDDDVNSPDRSAREQPGAAACAEVRELLAGAADLPLEPPQRSRVDAHLAACGPCRAVASWLPRVDAAAARSAPPPPPPQRWVEQLRSRVMDEVRDEAARTAGQAFDSPLRRGARAGRAGGLRGLWPAWPDFLRTPRALATFAVVALIGIFTYAEIRDRAVGTPQPLRAPRARQAGTDADAGTTPAPVGRLAAESPAPGLSQPTESAPVEAELRKAAAAPVVKVLAAEQVEVGLARTREENATSQPPGIAVASEAAPPPSVKAEADHHEFGEPARRPLSLANAPQQGAQKRDISAADETRASDELAHAGAAPSTPTAAPAAAPATAATETQEEATASFDLRTSEVLADAGDAIEASAWDEERVRGAIGLVMESRPPRDVEAAVGELLLALEDAPPPTKGFARLARRQSHPAPATVRPPEGRVAGRDRSDPAMQQFGARGDALTKDFKPGQPAIPAPSAPAWSSLAASVAATSLADSAATALLLRLSELPEGAVREQAVRWLRAHGLR